MPADICIFGMTVMGKLAWDCNSVIKDLPGMCMVLGFKKKTKHVFSSTFVEKGPEKAFDKFRIM